MDVTLTPELDDGSPDAARQVVYSQPVNPVTTLEQVVEGTAALRADILDGGPRDTAS